MPKYREPVFSDRPMSRDEKIFLGLFLGIVFTLFALEVFRDYQPAKLAMLLFPVAWALMLAVHEFGHAAAARLFGWGVQQVVIGMGRPLANREILGCPVEFRMIPIEGFVRFARPAETVSRWKVAFVYFAGPGVELLLAGLLILVIGPADYFRANESYWVIVAQAVGGAALIGGVINLIPAMAKTESGAVANDGLGIIRALMGRID